MGRVTSRAIYGHQYQEEEGTTTMTATARSPVNDFPHNKVGASGQPSQRRETPGKD